MRCSNLLFLGIRCLFFGWVLTATLPATAQLLPENKFLPDAIVGNAYNVVDFDLADGTDSNVDEYDWSAVLVESGGTVTNLADRAAVEATLELDLNEVNGVVTCDDVPNLAGSVVRFTVTAALTGGTTETDEFWLVIRAGALPDQGSYRIALVLDASGSMNASTSADLDGDGVDDSRWEVLQSTLRTYVPSLKNWTDASDVLQVVHFQGSGGPVSYNAMETFGDLSDSSTGNDAFLFNGNSPGGGTPLGAGIDALPAFTADRHAIIPFTDGYENRCPLALPKAGIACPPPETIALPATTYFPIGFEGTNEVLLADLAAIDSDGQSAFALDAEALDQLFLRTIPELFSGSTPRIVVFKTEQLPVIDAPGQIIESFRVDSLVRKLTLLLKCKSGNCNFNNDVTLELNEQTMPFPEFFSENEIRYNIDLPVVPQHSLLPLDGGGEWTLTCSALSGSEYDLTVMVDDEIFTAETTVNNGQSVYAGDPIPIRTDTRLAGEAFNNMDVVAYLLRPGEDPGRLFSDTDIVPPNPQESNPGPGLSQSSLLGQAKVDSLLSRPDIQELLQNEQRVIPLVRTADGRFTGTFSPNESEVSSHYQVVVRYEGYLPELDSINGMTIDYFMVRFSRPDDITLNRSIQYIPPVPGSEGVGGYRVTIRPTNQFGNPLGPGQAQNIRVQVNGTSIILEDQLDGTYTGLASNAPQQSEVEVFVLDGETAVWKRKLGSWGISLHAGGVAPANNTPPFDMLTGGLYYEGDVTYRFNKHWGVELLVGQNQFSHSFDLLEVGLYGTYRFANVNLAQVLTPYLKGGVGYHKPDGFDGGLGLGLRAGLSLPLTGNIEVGAELGIGYTIDPELLFTKAGVAAKYIF